MGGETPSQPIIGIAFCCAAATHGRAIVFRALVVHHPARKPPDKIADYLQREGFDVSCKRNCSVTKETGEHNIDLIGTEVGGSALVSA